MHGYIKRWARKVQIHYHKIKRSLFITTIILGIDIQFEWQMKDCQIILYWEVEGTRRRGNPRECWMDTVRKSKMWKGCRGQEPVEVKETHCIMDDSLIKIVLFEQIGGAVVSTAHLRYNRGYYDCRSRFESGFQRRGFLAFNFSFIYLMLSWNYYDGLSF